MSWAELQIPDPPPTDNIEFDAWLAVVVKHLKNYLGSFHDRGDAAANDFEEGDLTMDNAWNDMDLSSIIDADARAVVMSVHINDDNVATALSFRKNGNSNEINQSSIRTQVGGVEIRGPIFCACDSDGLIEYKATEAITDVAIRVTGWFK